MNAASWARVAGELRLAESQVRAVGELLDEGATIPFIARYRKERTGSLDEVAIQAIRDRLGQLKALDDRRAAIRESLTERNLLTDELGKALAAADSLTVLEDLYLPFRPKRRTRAGIARERGLEPLANLLLVQDPATDPVVAARPFLDQEKGVADLEAALQGARDILAETVSEQAEARQEIRALFAREGVVESRVAKGKEAEGAKFRDWFDWREPLARVPSHRLLALLRGENEGFLKVSVRQPEEHALALLQRRFVRGTGASGVSAQVREAVDDGYRRLLAPSLETEIRHEAKERADGEAIRVFAQNLRELLLAPPLGQKGVVAIDPGFRTGCKTVCLDPQGRLLHHTVLFFTGSDGARQEACRQLRELVGRFGAAAVAIGNGTGSRETEAAVRAAGLDPALPVVLVNEAGASVYSASEVAREEFPDHDVTVRGAVSIGRRLLDPLAELVKIDPKAIGVGQYQHDVDQERLAAALDETVTSCVNAVGVEVNTASARLLTYVSGLGPALARAIVAWRDANGPFTARAQLKKVPRLGPKAFEQCAGFLRVRGGKQPLDASAVHPERYALVGRMAADLGCGVTDLLAREDLRAQIRPETYVGEDVGLPTLRDILAELARPGRDPRPAFEAFSFAEGVHTLADLRPGMRLPGIVTNVTKFGAFVDIGVHQDGLVHVSQLADRFVRDPAEVVKVRQQVLVTVLEVDQERRRISLSLRTKPQPERGS
ncbi:MAG: RNA-binding transcriptional accessory protein [Candidatus Riflebacteria bacterium]|nr:RNA-binding transcriptional accessory protein [Candidatus Riflebacteria bacterium]